MTEYIGSAARHTGDINLAAAMMACGIPLDPSQPMAMVETKQKRYATFYLLEYSDDGTETAERLSSHWSGIDPLPESHGFSVICHFIKARPRGVQQSADLLDFAVDYLRERGETLHGLRNMQDVPVFVASLPESAASHVLAYIWNREICFQLYRMASRKIYYEQGTGNETRRALIDSRLPRWQAKEILSRLEG